MSKGYKRSPSAFLASYSNNAVIQLIIACGVGFIIFHFSKVVLLIAGLNKSEVARYIMSNVAMPSLAFLKYKWWTVLTYGWVHEGFWELFSNMIWLYCFGSVVQSLVGYRQVIPLFAYSLLIGGLVYVAAQLIPGDAFVGRPTVMGAQAGLMGLAAAAITIAPKYRLYLGPSLSVPILLVAGIFAALMVLSTGLQLSMIFLLLGGSLTGFLYITMLRNGYKPGEWVYNMFDRMEQMVTPDETKVHSNRTVKRNKVLSHMPHGTQDVSQKRIDEILDRINRHGYDSLSNEEKEILLKASKEN